MKLSIITTLKLPAAFALASPIFASPAFQCALLDGQSTGIALGICTTWLDGRAKDEYLELKSEETQSMTTPMALTARLNATNILKSHMTVILPASMPGGGCYCSAYDSETRRKWGGGSEQLLEL